MGIGCVIACAKPGAPVGDRNGDERCPVADASICPSRHRLLRVRLLANIIWFVLAGFWLFLGYAFAALLCFIFIVTIPFGVASLRIALFGVWPFGRAVVPQANKGVGSTMGNILWFILGGFWLALLHLVTGIFLCLTIIGIPLGIANFKLINVSMRPFGREIVSADEARRRGSCRRHLLASSERRDEMAWVIASAELEIQRHDRVGDVQSGSVVGFGHVD